jgi:hypothetical protein
MAPEEVNPNEFDEKLRPEEQQQINDLSPEQTEEIIEEALMPLDPDDDGYDAKEGIFRPQNQHWRKLLKENSLKERRLVPVHSKDRLKALKHHYILDPESYVTDTLTENTLCWYPDSRAMLLYLKNQIPADIQDEAKNGLDEMVFKDPTRAETKHATQFNARLGGPAVPAGELLFGFMDHGSVTMTIPTREQDAEYEKVKPLLRKLNNQFARTLPRHYAEQNRIIPADFRQFGTAFSTITTLKSCPSAVHTDPNGNKLGLTCMATIRGTDYKGGEFCLLEYGLKIPVKPGDVLIAATAREWHVNLTPVQGVKYSIVCYYRWGLANPKRLAGWRKRQANTHPEVET